MSSVVSSSFDYLDTLISFLTTNTLFQYVLGFVMVAFAASIIMKIISFGRE